MGKQFVLHVGLHKSGTTFLQNQVFTLLTNYNVITPNNLKFEINGLFARSDKSILLSHEGILGVPFNPKNTSWIIDQVTSIETIASFSQNFKIIIGFRKHSGMILSLYKQYLHEGGYLKFEQFFNFTNTGILKVEDLNYKNRVEALEKRFKGKIFIYTLEQIKSDSALFSSELFKFLGEPFKENGYVLNKKKLNEGVGFYQAKLLRRLNFASAKYFNLNNKIFKTLGLTPRNICQRKLRFISKKQITLSQANKQEIDTFYSADWSYIKKQTN